MIKVACVGVITVDTVALVDEYPEADERVLANQIVRSVGGPAAVAAVTLSRLEIPSAIIGTVGDDSDGRLALDLLEREGVDTSGVSITSDATSGSVIVASKSQMTRAISTRQPINQVTPNSKAQELVRIAQWVHVDHVGVKRLDSFSLKRGNGPKISFDAGYGAKDFDVSMVDLFAPNDRQMFERHPEKSTTEATKLDAISGKNLVVTTLGAKGSVGFSTESGLIEVPAIQSEIVSTLGAGDVFHGALLAGIIEGLPLKEAIYRANVVAALSCRGLDGISAIPTRVELLRYLEVGK